MKLFITGGVGFLGKALTNYLLSKNHQIIAYDNFSFGNRRDFLPNKNLEIIKGDILDFKFLKSSIIKFRPDVIVHLAAISYIPYCQTHIHQTIEVNVIGTLNVVLSTFEQKEDIKLIFSSSAAVYSDTKNSTGKREEDDWGAIDIYGMSKVFGEKIIKLLKVRNFNIIRFFNIYGLNDTNPHIIKEIEDQSKRKERIILGNNTKRDFIHIEDAIRGLESVVLHGQDKEIYNIGSGKSYSAREIFNLIRAIKNDKKLKIVFDEKKSRKIDRRNLFANIQKVRNQTGWRPQIELKRGLKEIFK